ncbi:HIT domain-containing protein [Candidatus Woesearchaeota archaeon]|nr:HIT domain-containing protein [Candidatus Woesearchaeota archaeon]
MDDCLFCKIVKKEIPSDIVYEDDNVLAFLDINPVRKGHTLVIPKNHSTCIGKMTDEEASNLVIKAKELAPKIMKAVGAKGFNFSTNCNREAGQVVFHTHFHIIPRNDSNELPHWPRSSPPKEELAEMKNTIVSFLKE